MNEEIALKLLVDAKFNTIEALSRLGSHKYSYEIVRNINTMTQFDAKIEFLGYLNKLRENI